MVDEKNYLSVHRKELFKPFINKIKYGSVDIEEKDKFWIFDYEASLGKTYTYIRALVDLHKNIHNSTDYNVKQPIKDTSKIKTLIVIKTLDECEAVEEEINQVANESIACAINSKRGLNGAKSFNWNDDSQIAAMKKYKIVIITQQKYIELCKNLKRAQKLFGERSNLIIDEEVDFVLSEFETLTASAIVNVEEEYLMCCKSEKEEFKRIVQDLRDMLAKKYDCINRVKLESDYEQKLNSFEINLKKSLNDYTFEVLKKKIKKGLIGKEETKKELVNRIIEEVKRITSFYNNKNVLAYKHVLFSYNPEIKPFMLKNNIWIDASSSFNYLYELNDKLFYKPYESKRVIDHSNSVMYIDLDTNTTTSAKEGYENFPDDVLNHIKNTYTKQDKILIITNKDECDYIDSKINSELQSEWKEWTITTTNYFKMRGTNEYKDYNVCYIIQQPQMIFPYYVFLYEYWINLGKTEEERITLNNSDMVLANYKDGSSLVHGFTNNKHLEQLRRTSQASSIYQGLKRISRNELPTCDMYIICKDLKILWSVKNQFNAIDAKPFKLDVEFKDKGKEVNTAPKRIKKWLSEKWDKEEITLYDMCVQCKCTEKNLKRILKENVEIINILREENLIIEKGILKKLRAEDITINEFLKERWDGSYYSISMLRQQYKLIDDKAWKTYKRTKEKREVWALRNIKLKKMDNINYIYCEEKISS